MMKSAINDEIGDKTDDKSAINDEIGDKTDDKSAINDKTDDKTDDKINGQITDIYIVTNKTDDKISATSEEYNEKTRIIYERILLFLTKFSPAKTQDIADFIGLQNTQTKITLPILYP